MPEIARERAEGAKYIIRRLESWGEKELKNEITRQELWQLTRSRLKEVGELLPIVDMLVDLGYLRVKHPAQAAAPRGGRPPSDRYFLALLNGMKSNEYRGLHRRDIRP